MKLYWQFMAAGLLLAVSQATAFEILALGASDINCKGVDRSKIFSAQLEELLRSDGMDVTVTNGGDDGDMPHWMINRMQRLISANTRLVIFDPGRNGNRQNNIEYVAKILNELQVRKVSVIYASHKAIQDSADAIEMAKKYGAHYYGHFYADVPRDRTHLQFDMPGGGHLTAEGCRFVAQRMLPLVRQVVSEAASGQNIAVPK